MANYIPFPAYHDFAPIDISYLFEDEKPAGKHGFLTAQGDRFVFEDGTPVPFCRMHELFSHSRSFLEYAFCALKSVSLIEMIRFQDDNATIVATNGLFYA